MQRPSNTPGNRRSGAGLALIAVLGIVFLVVLPFLPLLLAFIEDSVTGTNHVEGVCRALGIHGMLSKLYEPIIEFVSNLLG